MIQNHPHTAWRRPSLVWARWAKIESEILIEVTPEFVEIWDEDENRHAFQLFIDFKKKTVEYKPYD